MSLISLIVSKGFEKELIAEYETDGLHIQMSYASGKNFPRDSIIISWVEWERFAAWVEFQRKEEALG